MDPVSILVTLVQWAEGVPAIGKYVALVLGAIGGLAAVVSALVMAWHGVVSLASALAALPGLSGLSGLAASLQADSAVVDADSNQLLSWIERFSVVPVPQAPQATPVVVPKT